MIAGRCSRWVSGWVVWYAGRCEVFQILANGPGLGVEIFPPSQHFRPGLLDKSKTQMQILKQNANANSNLYIFSIFIALLNVFNLSK